MGINIDYHDFEEKMKTYSEQFFSSLDDYTQAYVNHRLQPNDQTASSYYYNITGNLDKLQESIIDLTDNINNSAIDFKDRIKELDLKIAEEKIMNKELTTELTSYKNTAAGSNTLISNMKENYNRQYFVNICVLLGICLEIYAIKYIS